jgi:hypothetical protein
MKPGPNPKNLPKGLKNSLTLLSTNPHCPSGLDATMPPIKENQPGKKLTLFS